MSEGEKAAFAILLIGIMALSGLCWVLAIQIGKLEASNRALAFRVFSLDQATNKLSEEKAQLESELRKYRLSRPSMEELQRFLAEDPTDRRPYDPRSYVCINYAKDLREAARLRGYNISMVIINVEGYSQYHGAVSFGHALNGVILADGSHVYIEPSKDMIVSSLEEILRAMDPEWRLGLRIVTMVEVW